MKYKILEGQDKIQEGDKYLSFSDGEKASCLGIGIDIWKDKGIFFREIIAGNFIASSDCVASHHRSENSLFNEQEQRIADRLLNIANNGTPHDCMSTETALINYRLLILAAEARREAEPS